MATEMADVSNRVNFGSWVGRLTCAEKSGQREYIGTCPEKKVWNSVSGKYRTSLHLVTKNHKNGLTGEQLAVGMDSRSILTVHRCGLWLTVREYWAQSNVFRSYGRVSHGLFPRVRRYGLLIYGQCECDLCICAELYIRWTAKRPSQAM